MALSSGKSRSAGSTDTDSFAAVLRAWGNNLSDLSKELGVPYATVSSWRRRDSIPSGWFDRIVDAARSQAIRRITLSRLRAIESLYWSRRRARKPPESSRKRRSITSGRRPVQVALPVAYPKHPSTVI
jgi:hypothetical protein